MKALFTPEELAELEAIDAEIDNEPLTAQEYRESAQRDKAISYEREPGRAMINAYQRKYRAANREKLAAYQREYREANREKLAAQQREYRAARKARKGS